MEWKGLHNRSRIFFLTFFVLVGLLNTSCFVGSKLSDEEEKLRFDSEVKSGQEVDDGISKKGFRLVIPQFPRHFNPQLRMLMHEKGLIDQLYEGLTASTVHGQFKLQQAEKIGSTLDYKEWTVYLRRDLAWSDGSPVLPSDYRRTWLEGMARRAWQEALCEVLSCDVRQMPFYQVALSSLLEGSAELIENLKPFAREEVAQQTWLSSVSQAEFWSGLNEENLKQMQLAEKTFLAREEVQTLFANFSKVKADDQKGELFVQLAQGLAAFPEWLNDPYFYPQKLNAQGLSLFNSAYRLADEEGENQAHTDKISAAKELVLLKNPYYWDVSNLHLPRLVVSVEEQAVVAYENYHNKLYDYFGEPFYSIPKERREGAILHPTALIFPSSRLGYFWVDENFSLFNSPTVRHAFYDLLDAPFLSAAILVDDSPVFPQRSSPRSDLREAAQLALQESFPVDSLEPLNEAGIVGLGGPEQTEYRLLVAGSKEWLGALRLRLLLRRSPKAEENVHFSYQTLWLPTSLQVMNRGDETLSEELSLAANWFTYLAAAGYQLPTEQADIASLSAENIQALLHTMPDWAGILPLHRRTSLILVRPNTKGIYLSPGGQLALRDVVLFPSP